MDTLKSVRDVLDSFDVNEDFAIDYFYDINYKISELLVKYRTDKKLTQKQLAKKLGVSQIMISKYESGDYNFSLKKLCQICAALNIKPCVGFLNTDEQDEWTVEGNNVNQNISEDNKICKNLIA